MQAQAAGAEPSPRHDGGVTAPPHLPFLDGIRGLAALWVLLFHLQGQMIMVADAGRLGSLRPERIWGAGFLACGHDAVGMFIVLSGFCLSLPVFASPEGRLKGGLRRFFSRRARRILPAYYASLAVGLAANFVVQRAIAGEGKPSLSVAAQFEPGMLLSHVLLVHNFWPHWNISINPVFWSLAVEWQIYALFALLLLPLWHRLSCNSMENVRGSVWALIGVVSVAFGLGYAPLWLLPAGHNLVWCFPWMLGLFALGMAGAWAVLHAAPLARKLPISWGTACLLCIGAILAIRSVWSQVPAAVTDPLVGMAVVSGIAFCAVTPVRTIGTPEGIGAIARKGMVQTLQSPFCRHLGAISYSLYLFHCYVIQFLRTAVVRLGMSAPLTVIVYEIASVVAAVAVATVSYRLFERPFLTRDAKIVRGRPEATMPTFTPFRTLKTMNGNQ